MISRLVADGQYEFSQHAERERELDKIFIEDLEEALRADEIH